MSKLQIKKGLAANVSGITPDVGEPVWETDTQQLKIGDNTTLGGIPVASIANTVATEALLIATPYKIGDVRFLTIDNVGSVSGTYQAKVSKTAGGVVGDWELISQGNINAMADVDSSTLGDGYRLAWNDVAQKWEPKISVSGAGVLILDYRWDDTNSATPASGRISRSINDDTNGNSVTVYINEKDRAGRDMSILIKELTPGAFLNIFKRNDSTSAHRYDVDGIPVYDGVNGVYAVPCLVFDTVGAGPNDGNRLQVYIRTVSPDNKLPVGGTVGQHLTKVDGTNYNVEWSDTASAVVTTTVTGIGTAVGELLETPWNQGDVRTLTDTVGTSMAGSYKANTSQSVAGGVIGDWELITQYDFGVVV